MLRGLPGEKRYGAPTLTKRSTNELWLEVSRVAANKDQEGVPCRQRIHLDETRQYISEQQYPKERNAPNRTSLNCAKREEPPGLPPWGKRFAMAAVVVWGLGCRKSVDCEVTSGACVFGSACV
jgi:hypothetical protein